MSQQLTTQPAQSDPLLAVIERAAHDPNTDVSKMERLLAMAKDIRATEAESAFRAAMSEAQGEMQPISRDCNNPQTRSKYASYQNIDNEIRPIYTKHGFAMSFGSKTSPIAEHVIVTCRVSHRAGHSELLEIDMPADGRGLKGGDMMTKTHATGSALTYGKRYLAGLIWNLSYGETDDDGNGASPRQQSRPREESESKPAISTITVKGKKLAKVEKFSGETEKTKTDGSRWMKPWTRLGVTLDDGSKCGLFVNTDEDKALATKCELLQARQVSCDVTVKQGQKDGTWDLVSIEESDGMPQ